MKLKIRPSIGRFFFAGIKGFEPLLPRPERGVLPLDDIPVRLAK